MCVVKVFTMKQLLGFIIIIINLIKVSQSFNKNGTEGQLKAALFKEYDQTVRPVLNVFSPVRVGISVALNQIVNVDEVSETLTCSLWIRLQWKDEYLVWNETEFPGIRNIKMHPSSVWLPDITLYNDIREEERDIMRFPLDIFPDGNIHWHYPVVMKLTCKLNVKDFPFDQQICILKFGSWSHSMSMLDMYNVSESGDTHFYVENTEWELLDFPIRRHEVNYLNEESFVDVSFYAIIRRKPLFYLFNLVFPCVIITLLSIAGFYLPPESGEKVSLQITTLLALTVFQLIVAESMPPQSEVIPCIGLYFGCTVAIVGFGTLSTIFVLQLNYRGESGAKLQRWMRIIFFKKLAPLILMNKNVILLEKEEKRLDDQYLDTKNVQETGTNMPLMSDAILAKDFNNIGENHPGGPRFDRFRCDDDDLLIQARRTTKQLEIITEIQKSFERSQKSSSVDTRNKDEWKLVALMVDRISLVMTSLVFICITLSLFTYRPDTNLTPESKKWAY